MESPPAGNARAQSDSKSIDQDVLSRIQHLNVTKHIITDSGQKTVAHGGYSEVCRGCLLRVGNEQVDVAIKRLRFHTGEEKVMKVHSSLLIAEKLIFSHDLFRNSIKKSTYGQNCPIQTSYRYWVTPFAKKRTSPC